MIRFWERDNCSYSPCKIYIKVLANLKDYKTFPFGFDLQKALTEILNVFFFCLYVCHAGYTH